MRVSYLIWSNDHGGWWGPGRGGYTTSLERAGRYSGAEAKAIVDTASVDGHLWHPDGRVLPDVMVVAPEHRTAGCDVSSGTGHPVEGVTANWVTDMAREQMDRIKDMCRRLEELTTVDPAKMTGVRNEPGIRIVPSSSCPACGHDMLPDGLHQMERDCSYCPDCIAIGHNAGRV